MEVAIKLLKWLSSRCNALQGLVFFEKTFYTFFKCGSCCPNLWWLDAMKTAFYKLPVIYGNTKLVGSLLKEMYTLSKQQINNELRPNDFNKGVSTTQETKTRHVVRFEYFNKCLPLPSAPKGK